MKSLRASLRRLIGWVGYGLTTIGLALVALEGVVRLLGLAPPMPTGSGPYVQGPWLPFMLRPGKVWTGRSASDEFSFRYEHNSFGLRDREHARAKPAGTFRILGLGDSFSYGIGAAFEETYLARLEQRLNSRQRPVEVIKAGIPRFFPEAERLFLERFGLEYQPDLVLVAFEPNDIGDTYQGLDALAVGLDGYLTTRIGEAVIRGWPAPLASASGQLYRHSDVTRLVLTWWSAFRAQRTVQWEEFYKPDGFHEADWREVERQFLMMAELTRAAGAEMVLIHIPQKGPFKGGRHGGETPDEETRLWVERLEYPPRRLAAWAARHGIRFIDVLPALKDAPGRDPLYWAKDGHCTGLGYTIIGDAVYRRLTDDGLVP